MIFDPNARGLTSPVDGFDQDGCACKRDEGASKFGAVLARSARCGRGENGAFCARTGRLSQLADKRIEAKTALANLVAKSRSRGGPTGEDTEGVAVFEGSVDVSNEGGAVVSTPGPSTQSRVQSQTPASGAAFKIIHKSHRHDAHPRSRPEPGGHLAAGERRTVPWLRSRSEARSLVIFLRSAETVQDLISSHAASALSAMLGARRLAAAFRRLSLCLLKTSSIGGIVVISDPKAPGIIKFSQADEVLRRDTEYHTCPLGADVAAAARIPFPAHRTLSWLRTGGSRRRGTTIRTWGHDHCKATSTACAR